MIESKIKPVARRWRYLPEIAGSLWLIIYACIKFQAVAVGLKPYHVNPYIFFLLDTLTIPSYVWGTGQLLRRLHRHGIGQALLAPFFVALLSLLAPYAYLFLCGGRDFPPLVSLIILAVLSFSLFFSYRRLRQRWQH